MNYKNFKLYCKVFVMVFILSLFAMSTILMITNWIDDIALPATTEECS